MQVKPLKIRNLSRQSDNILWQETFTKRGSEIFLSEEHTAFTYVT